MIETETVIARKPTSLYDVESAVVPISAVKAWQGFFRKAKLELRQDISAGALRRGPRRFAQPFDQDSLPGALHSALDPREGSGAGEKNGYPPIRSVRSSHTKCLWNP